MPFRSPALNAATAAAVVALAANAQVAAADVPSGLSGYVLAEGGQALLVMTDLSAPAEVETVALETALLSIATRPVTGDLLGFTRDAIYTIDPATGALTDLDATFIDDAATADGAFVSLDFNNAIDAVRAVSTAGDNLVYFPDDFGDDKAGSVRRFTGLAYAAGDANEGAGPMVFANAYTNAVAGATAESTFQYALDAETDALVSLANNEGTLATVSPVTVDGAAADLAAAGGFDIASPAEGEDLAYAVLQLEGAAASGLYEVDLESGALTLLAEIAATDLTGFAVGQGM